MGRKIFLAISSALLLVGIALSVVGFALGGGSDIGELEDENRFTEIVDTYVTRGGNPSASQVEDKVSQALTREEKQSATIYSGEEFQSSELVRSVDVELHVGKLEIRKGDEFKVENNGGDANLSIIGQNGAWTISQREYNMLLGSYSSYKYIVTLPEDIENLTLNCSAGKIDVKDLNLSSLDVDLDAGAVSVKNINSDYMYFNIAAGALEGKSLNGNVMEINCDAGAASIECEIRQSLTANVNAGAIKVKMKKPNEYSWNINTELGTVQLDNMRYSGLSQTGSGGEGEPHISLDCSVGSIELKFN